MSVIYYRRNQNSPLTCEQFDSTLDALLDRSNHTGTQSASTIYDLSSTVQAFSFIQSLLSCCSTLTTDLDNLRTDLFGQGELNTIISTLRNQLLQNISDLQSQLDSLNNSLTSSGTSLSGLAASITSLSQQIQGLQNQKANVNSPTLTGIPRAPQPLSTSNDDQIATTLFVKSFSVPLGVILPYGGSSPPDISYLFAQGQAISRVTYSALFALYGTTYGSGDGSSTFNLPNLSYKVPIGPGVSSTTTYSLGQIGGEESHTLIVPETPSHTHSGTMGDHTHSASSSPHNHRLFTSATGEDVGGRNQDDAFTEKPHVAVAGEDVGGLLYIYANADGTQLIEPTSVSVTVGSSSGGSVSLSSTGGDQSHNNMQPFIVLNYIIKAL